MQKGLAVMAKQRRPGRRALYVEVPEALGQALEDLAATNRRTLTAEVVIALERHLASEGIKVLTTAPRKRGRPKAKGGDR